jgi:hypothetical protein
VLEARGELDAAREAYAADLDLSRRLVEQAPDHAPWQRELALTCVKLARLELRAGHPDLALPHYDEAARVYDTLAGRPEGLGDWAGEKDTIEAERLVCRVLARELGRSATSRGRNGTAPHHPDEPSATAS